MLHECELVVFIKEVEGKQCGLYDFSWTDIDRFTFQVCPINYRYTQGPRTSCAHKLAYCQNKIPLSCNFLFLVHHIS